MKPPLPTLVCLSFIAFLPLARSAEVRSSGEIATSTPPARAVPLMNINIDFPGGPVSGLVEAMAKIDGVSLNLIAADDAVHPAQIILPPFSLRNVSVLNVIELVQTMLERHGLALRPIGGGNNPNSWVGVLFRPGPLPDAKPALQTQFESFSLRNQLAEQTVDDIVGAIRAGWELDPAHDRDALRIKFHPPTSILLVSGPPEAIGVAAKVISRLTGSPSQEFRPANGNRPAPPPPEQRR